MTEAVELGDEPEVLVAVDAGICVVTLNRPKALNAMTATMADAYAEALRAADDDPKVRAIIVTGAGRGFCAGADVAVLRRGAEAIREFVPSRENLPSLVYDLRKPVIAALNGHVVGIGLAYALGSDIRIMDETASITSLFAQMGLVAEYGVSWSLPRLVGLTTAMDLLLTGRKVTAEEALRLNLVNQVVPAGTSLTVAIEYATHLVDTCSPASLQAIKEQLYLDVARTRSDALTDTLARMDFSFSQPGIAEALLARAEKRPAVFEALPARSDS